MPKPYAQKSRRRHVRELVARTAFPAPTKKAVVNKLALFEKNYGVLEKTFRAIDSANHLTQEQSVLRHDLSHLMNVQMFAAEIAQSALTVAPPNIERADSGINLALRALDFSRHIATRGTAPLRRISAPALAKKLAIYPSLLAESKRLTGRKPVIMVRINAMPVTLNADPAWLMSIVLNLCDNASRAAGKAGRVLSDFRTDSKNFIITVSNTGESLSEQDKKSFLEAKGLSTKESEREKHGFGQMSIKHALQLHNGTLEIRDNKPKGAIFIVKIPLAK